MTSYPHGMLFILATMLAVWLMLQAGLAKKALEFRRARRTCPSCGLIDNACRCREHPTPHK
jgi:hypothetical protein